MSLWRMRLEFWETQGLCYIILSNQLEATHPWLSNGLFWYGIFCFAGALYALCRTEQP